MTVWEFLKLVAEGVVWCKVKTFLARIRRESVLGLYCVGTCLRTHPDTDQSSNSHSSLRTEFLALRGFGKYSSLHYLISPPSLLNETSFVLGQ